MGSEPTAGAGESEDLEDLFEHAPCGYVSTLANGRITKVNQTFATWIGFEKDRLVGRRFLDLLNIAGKIYYETHFAPLLRMQGFFNEVALDISRSDETVLPVLVNAVTRKDSKGDVRFIRITIFNASDRRRYEHELLAARRQAEQATGELRELNLTLEAQVAERTRALDRAWRLSPDLRVIAGTDGILIAVNSSWTDLLGWKASGLLGHSFVEFTHPDDLTAAQDVFANIMAAPLIEPYEYRLRHADGSYRWFSWTAAFEDGQVYATGRHTTIEHERAAALAEAEAALRQSHKMEAVGQLTGGLAHDFNNLLAGISGSLELMQARLRQGKLADFERYLAASRDAARRAAALTHRLLAFSRRQTLDPKSTNVNKLVAGMEEMIRRTVGPSIHIEVVGASGLWMSLVDPPQLENALLNLCINARDAMPEGGRITVETANKWVDEHGARKHDMPTGQYISLCVTDTGTGMPPEVIAKAFDPFFTTKPIGQGTGLGLSMVYGFARQSNGQVRIYSEVGVGTTVCIYLPRHYGKTEESDVPARLAELPRAGHGGTVLVVDDEPTVRMLVMDVLEQLGHVAIEAADSIAGLKVLQSDVPIDLLITDVGLPGGMNGRQMADAGRAKRSGLKVLFITGYAENAVLGNGHLEPGMHVMTKPFAMERLALRIKDLMEAA
jgi:PAS domain S-box-containing protein